MEKKIIMIVNKFIQEEIKDSNKNLKLRDLGMDSMASIELLIEIEKEFKIQIPDKYLTPDTFESFNNLKKAISNILNDK
ncbi:acyl carrier protein [Enterococcus sp. DIV0212c]|uniref:phosphopantetheine-binding protein n=1 Tax=Enterococcus sp. DIV0212c TaxID=2230867 RepID=UPI001A9AF74C|nr:phosphopantetheine-binding protein [Enterococcus sp. DIV0212c]MBO1354662.1 acyl carrier protein [Enterococcus sp. DIV0212c]